MIFHGRYQFSEEFSISQDDPLGSIYSNSVLVKLVYFNINRPSFVPFEWVWACLVLHSDLVAYSEWRESFSVETKTLSLFHVF